jgi:hypothetical protein
VKIRRFLLGLPLGAQSIIITLLLIVVKSHMFCLLNSKEFYSSRISSYIVRRVNPREETWAACVTAMGKARHVRKV